MTKINCRSVRREIDDAELGAHLSSLAYAHLKQCAECETFCEERTKLRDMVASLGIVAAPGDFEFRLRARLAGETRGSTRNFALSDLFGVRAATFALVLLAVVSALVFVSFRSPATNNVASKPQPESTLNAVNPENDEKKGIAVAATPLPVLPPTSIAGDQRVAKRRQDRGSQSTRDFAGSQAKVFNQANLTEGSNVFPIAASYQKLRLSVDNGRGNSRTISLPGVSFGSQRSVSQNPSALMASARDAW